MTEFLRVGVFVLLLGSSFSCMLRDDEPRGILHNPGVGEGLPDRGTVPKAGEGPIYYDSLYVGPDGSYYRFWPSGYVMVRDAFLPMSRALSREDGEVIGDNLRATDICRFTVVGDDIYIEQYVLMPSNWQFRVYRGRLSDEAFVLSRMRVRSLPIWPGWRDHGPDRFVRCKVGTMLGTDPPELFIQQ